MNRPLKLGRHFRGTCGETCCQRERHINAVEVVRDEPERWIQPVEVTQEGGKNFERRIRLNFPVAQ
eukprot:3780193-Karenia_brevis.AAC.1